MKQLYSHSTAFITQAIACFKAHNNGIAALQLSHDGSLVFTASLKGTIIRVFSVSDGSRLYKASMRFCMRNPVDTNGIVATRSHADRYQGHLNKSCHVTSVHLEQQRSECVGWLRSILDQSYFQELCMLGTWTSMSRAIVNPLAKMQVCCWTAVGALRKSALVQQSSECALCKLQKDKREAQLQSSTKKVDWM